MSVKTCLVIHNGIDINGHTVLCQNLFYHMSISESVQGIILNLLRRHVVGLCPEVDLLVLINAGDDEEDSGPPCLPCQHPAQPEHHRPLVLLHHLDRGNEL